MKYISYCALVAVILMPCFALKARKVTTKLDGCKNKDAAGANSCCDNFVRMLIRGGAANQYIGIEKEKDTGEYICVYDQ